MRYLLLGLIFILTVNVSIQSEIYLDSNNALQNMVIFIKDNVPEDDGKLLTNVKNYVNEASKSLWKATSNLDSKRSGVKFGTVHIVIPRNWKMKVFEYITWQQCSKADILITTKEENDNKNEPYTKQIGNCGEPGNFTRLPLSFFTESPDVVLQGKKIMTEFVKLRYGVFSEKPYQNKLTVYNGSSFEQSSCGKNIKWELSKYDRFCCEKDNDCTYQISQYNNHNYSVMFDEKTKSSELFCNDNDRPHNKMASSLQNLKCNKQSISSVILTHNDFKTEMKKQNFTDVTFKILTGQNRKLILVLDVSSSMQPIIDNMKKAVINFISETVEETAEMGLASFSSEGKIETPLLQMNNSKNKKILIEAVNRLISSGFTNIPDGLRKGIQILGGDMEKPDFVYGTIFLLTDGENNRESQDWDNLKIIKNIILKGLVVNSIVYGNIADNRLNTLATKCGGRFIYANPQLSYTNLMNIFALRSFCDSVENSTIKVMEGKRNFSIAASVEIINLIYTDQYVGKDLFLTITLKVEFMKYNITLISPSSQEYSCISNITQSSIMTFTFKVIGKVEMGFYKLKFNLTSKNTKYKRSTETVSINYVLSATPNKDSPRIINPSGEVSPSEIETVIDSTTVVATVDLSSSGIKNDENVFVKLLMEYPDKIVTLEREILDNGLGCDSIDGDRIYSVCVYPKELNQIDFYTFSAEVKIFTKNIENPIQRAISLGSTRVKKVSPNIQDKIPPARIDNLNVNIVNAKTRILKIDILATGDDGIVGNISKYNIKIVNYNETIIEQYKESIPLQPISFTINLFNATSNEPFKIYIQGVDKSGNMGEWSPEQIFSWNYGNDNSKFAMRKSLNSWFIGVCVLISAVSLG